MQRELLIHKQSSPQSRWCRILNWTRPAYEPSVRFSPLHGRHLGPTPHGSADRSEVTCQIITLCPVCCIVVYEFFLLHVNTWQLWDRSSSSRRRWPAQTLSGNLWVKTAALLPVALRSCTEIKFTCPDWTPLTQYI